MKYIYKHHLKNKNKQNKTCLKQVKELMMLIMKNKLSFI